MGALLLSHIIPQRAPAAKGRFPARLPLFSLAAGAGSGDLILPEETRRIAAGIPGAKLQIVQGEDHGSYIVHSTRIAAIIREFVLA